MFLQEHLRTCPAAFAFDIRAGLQVLSSLHATEVGPAVSSTWPQMNLDAKGTGGRVCPDAKSMSSRNIKSASDSCQLFLREHIPPLSLEKCSCRNIRRILHTNSLSCTALLH